MEETILKPNSFFGVNAYDSVLLKNKVSIDKKINPKVRIGFR
ncbi:hypothetical protein LEP1GSC017_1190 [Leptospira meyeri serovar Hardjo str. Went 5]|nr:hypothetical protein LEP1GSC017_1190 [Leptospira meyeri serovar Hardjo str. Went 5]